jgi:hypothetical protein
MPAKGVCKVGVPFGIVGLSFTDRHGNSWSEPPYALLCSLQKLWHVATEKLITPTTMLRL